MKVLGYFIGFAILALTLAEDCDHLGVLLYEDLGCTPEYGESKTCPIKYTCVGLEPPNLHDANCYFRGKTFKDGEAVEDSSSGASCHVGCHCSGFRITCATLDCPEWLGGNKIKPECYRTYSLNSCCSAGSQCPPYSDIQNCTVDGTDYKEGQGFHPENTCQSCICQKGFGGKYEEPFCKRQTCNVQLQRKSGEDLRAGCAPLYERKSEKVFCCPGGWICPDGTETITGVAKRDDVCRFGNKTLKVGQGFEKENIKTSFGQKIQKVSCECILPPLLTCNEV